MGFQAEMTKTPPKFPNAFSCWGFAVVRAERLFIELGQCRKCQLLPHRSTP